MANMKATLVHRSKTILANGAIVEMVIWRVPEPVPGSMHSFKYRLFYGRNGVRIVGFDNERQKGDHCHIDGIEKTYHFIDVDLLVDDFLGHVKRRQE